MGKLKMIRGHQWKLYPTQCRTNLPKHFFYFYRAAVDRRKSCPSVRLSIKRVNCDKTEEQSDQIFIPYERYLA